MTGHADAIGADGQKSAVQQQGQYPGEQDKQHGRDTVVSARAGPFEHHKAGDGDGRHGKGIGPSGEEERQTDKASCL